MASPRSGKCLMLIPVILVLGTGLIYTGCAFRIRDTISVSSDVCQSATGRCASISDIISSSSSTPSSSSSSPASSPADSSSSSSFSSSSSTGSSSWSTLASMRAKRGFETVSMRGSFVKSKQRPLDDGYEEQNYQSVKKNYKISSSRPWSKLNKIEDTNEQTVSTDAENKNPSSVVVVDEEEEDDDEEDKNYDEIILIEVEDEDDMIIESEVITEEVSSKQKKGDKLNIDEEEKAEAEKKYEEGARKEIDEVKRRREEELLKRNESEVQKEEEARRIKEQKNKIQQEREEMEHRKREDEEERRIREKEEEYRKREKEEERRKREEEEERRKREEEEERRKREEEEERRKREEEEERRKREEEEERRKQDEIERRLQEEAERKLKEEKERRLKEELERKFKKQEQQRLKEEAAYIEKQEQERRQKEEEIKIMKEKERKRLQMERGKKLKEEKERKLKDEKKQKLEEKEEEEEEENDDKRRKKLKENEIIRLEMEEKNAKKMKDPLENTKMIDKENEKNIREDQEKVKIITLDGDNNGKENDNSGDNNERVTLKLQNTGEKLRLSNKEKANDIKSATITKTISDETSATTKSKSQKIIKDIPSLTEFNDMILNVPNFMPNFTAMENAECQRHGKIFLRQLRGYKMWAFQMLDSSAKIPAGLLRGNVNQFGDFDQCLGILAHVKVDEKTIKVQGKYCLASMDIYATHLGLKLPVYLMQSRGLLRGNMHDPGHFLPKFTTINWGICLPAACSATDARRSIEDALGPYNMTIGIKFMVNIDNEMCYVKQNSQSYSKETIGVLYFYAIFICLVIVATVRDYFAISQEKGNYSERIIMAFSLKRTIKVLFGNRESTSSSIGCVHGIKALLTMALYTLQKLITTLRMPYANRVTLTEVANSPLSSALRASIFHTDSFLLLSGLITAYNMSTELSNRGEIRWFCRFIVRFIRLTPTLLAVIFWYAFVMEHTGSGPQWNTTVKANADMCKENAWINLLHVQNFFPFEEMCAAHTHQLALDMQLSLLAPAIVFFLQVKPIVGVIVVFLLLQVSATLRYFATSNNNLSLVIFHGMTLKQIYKTANMTYLLPLHRATPYLIGICLGVILHYTGKSVFIHKVFIILGWLVALALGLWSMFSPWQLARADYTYNVDKATQYAVLSPIFTALALSWTIFACFTNNGGIINKVLSSHWMMVFSRLSYAIYLSQYIVFFYNIGTTRYSSEFQPYKIIDFYEVLSITIVSTVLTLLFDIPMQEVKKIILEITESLPTENGKSKECNPLEDNDDVKKSLEKNHLENEEESITGNWNWNRGTFTKIANSEPRDFAEDNANESYNTSPIKRSTIRRQTMIRSEAYDEWDRDRMDRRISRSEEHSMDNGRANRNDYDMNNLALDDDLSSDNYLYLQDRHYSSNYTRSPMRDTRSQFRSSSRERDYNNKPIITISKEDEYANSRSSRSTMSRFFDQQFSLSESDIDVLGCRRNSNSFNRRSSAELRISDDDDWENDLRFRRNRYPQDRVQSQETERLPPPPVVKEEINNEWDSLKRRSSAEGKMALLKEPLRPGNMELWTVSKMQFGSSQESDDELDEETYLQQRREYREQGPPLREEFEEDEGNDEEEIRQNIQTERRAMSFDAGDEITNEFMLNKNSKRITVQDLSRISLDDEISKDNNWSNVEVKSNSGLIKRESIIKSQASEEDPEYLIPERPKLFEQEQEHPFKKAWQMQKSRSEEEGPSGFIIKDYKTSSATLPKQNEELENRSEEGKTNDIDKSKENDVADIACDVALDTQSSNNEIDAKKRNCESDILLVASMSKEANGKELNGHPNAHESDENSETDT